MNNSIAAAAASVAALQQKLDLLANNIANADTVGYKRKTSVFEDLLTSLQPQENAFNQPGRRTPIGFTQGWGARLAGMQIDLSQGSLQPTGNPTDLAIEGNGLFEVRTTGDLAGPPAYTRHGDFALVPTGNGDRILVTNSGQPVIGQVNGVDDFIYVPDGYEMKISEDGTILAYNADGSDVQDLGKLKVVQVTKPDLLQEIGDNLYGVPANVNPADVVQTAVLSANGGGGLSVRQGFLESSNVNLTDEITDLVSVQRAYQLSARALSSADQMMQMAANLRG